MRAMILAAGNGSRLGPLTQRRSKPVLPLANQPLLAYTFRLLANAGVTEAAVNLHHAPETVRESLGTCCEGVAIHYSPEAELRGTAGALLPVAGLFDETFLVVYGDNLLDVDLPSLIDFHRQRGATATIGLCRAPDPTAVGIVGADDAGWVTSFREKPTLEELQSAPYPPRLGANAGIYVLEPEILDSIPPHGAPDFGHDLFPALLRSGARIAAAVARGYVQDTGTLLGYRHAHSDLLLGWMPRIWRPEEEGLWQWEPGIFVHETGRVAATARLQAPCLVGPEAFVGAGACLGPNVCLGPGVVIEPEADLIDTIAWAGAQIGGRASLRHCVITNGCRVGAEAHLLDVALPEGASVAAGARRGPSISAGVEASP
jgi:NDP-sugar pyrophosphorylase family protein